MGKKKAGGPTLAEQMDRHELYQNAVQSPDADLEFFIDTYKKLRGRPPLSMREDFCGTALLSLEWCKSDPARTAIGVDLDEPTLEWGRKHNLEPAGEVGQRVRLIHGNVLDKPDEQVDLTCACNFSYQVFKTRAALRSYFEAVRAGLKPDGLFIMDILGGTETMDELEEEREVDDEDFTYIWDQDKFDPITHDMICHIHFEFEDGSRMDRAFTYEWRLWMIPELTELLKEAGFSKVRVYWEEFVDDEDDEDEMEGTGLYYEQTEAEQQESWVNYIVAEP